MIQTADSPARHVLLCVFFDRVPECSNGVNALGAVEAGWPSPAEEELRDILSLDDLLIKNREASFLLRVSGDSMSGAGILPGDLVIVDRGQPPRSGDIVIAEVDTH